jgi:hypothetical protein
MVDWLIGQDVVIQLTSHQLTSHYQGTNMDTIITIIYYCLVAFASAVLIYNFIKTRDWQKEVLTIIVVLPFLLRLFMLK